MKKIFTLLLAIAAILGLASCGNNNNEEKTPEAIDNTVTFLTSPITEENSVSKVCANGGTVTSVSYNCHAYALEELYGESNIFVDKQVNVYTPYGYSTDKKYDVWFLLHGSGQNEDYWFAQDDYAQSASSTVTYGKIGNITKNVIDNLIDTKVAKEMIVVSCTYYASHDSTYGYGTEAYPGTKTEGETTTNANFSGNFWKELRNDILPLIITNYSTYAESTSERAIVDARDHFAYSGLSLGSMTAFQSIFMHCLDYISYIGCYSAGPAAINKLTDANKEKLDSWTETFLMSWNGPYADYKINYWYNGCGTYDNLGRAQKYVYEALLEDAPNKLSAGNDKVLNNCYYNETVEAGHEYWSWICDFYNSCLVFFQK